MVIETWGCESVVEIRGQQVCELSGSVVALCVVTLKGAEMERWMVDTELAEFVQAGEKVFSEVPILGYAAKGWSGLYIYGQLFGAWELLRVMWRRNPLELRHLEEWDESGRWRLGARGLEWKAADGSAVRRVTWYGLRKYVWSIA